jgi:predicted Zn-dependent protease
VKFAPVLLLTLALAGVAPAAIKANKSDKSDKDYWPMAEKALQQGDFDAALDALDALLKDHPEHTQGHLWRARILADRDQLDEALTDIDAVLKAEPQNSGALAQRGPATVSDVCMLVMAARSCIGA